MTHQFTVLTQPQAETIAYAWHYEGDYAFYNMEADEEDLAEFLDAAQRGQSVFAVASDGELVGFVSVAQTDAETVDLGLGMKPDLTGNGSGRAFVTSILDFVNTTYSPHRITLSGAPLLMDAVAAAYIGYAVFGTGRPNVVGTLIGAILIGILLNGLTMWDVPYYAQDIVKGAILIAALGLSYIQKKQLT